MPGSAPPKDAELCSSLNHKLAYFSRNFMLASTPTKDILPLLARGEREQAAVREATVAKASQPGAQRPLPFCNTSSSDTQSLTTTPILTKRTWSIGVSRQDLRKTPSEPNITFDDMSHNSRSPTVVVTKAGNKAFGMQIGEVDAAKAVSPAVVQSFSTVMIPTGDQVGIDQNQYLNDDFVDDGTKRKPKPKSNKGPGPKDEISRNEFLQFSMHGKHDGGHKSKANDDYRYKGKKFSKDLKNGTYQGDFPHPGKIGASTGRGYRSNTFNETNAPQPGRRQDQNQFQSLRAHPRKLWDEKITPAHHAKKLQNATFESSPRQLKHLVTPDVHGYNSPHGTWYPRPSVQSQGPSPPFMPTLDVQTPHLPLQPLVGGPPPPPETFTPLLFESSYGGPVLLQGHSRDSARRAVDLGRFREVAQSNQTSRFQDRQPKSFTNSAKNVESAIGFQNKDGTEQDRSSERSQFPIRAAPCFIDPRTANVRIESIMRTVGGELEVLKGRISRGQKNKISDVDTMRYLDICISLCKDAIAASNELTMENVNLKVDVEKTKVCRREASTSHQSEEVLSMGDHLYLRGQSHDHAKVDQPVECDVGENPCRSILISQKLCLLC